MSTIKVFTDGSCMKRHNGYICGYGIHFPNKELPDISRHFTHEPLTNQRAELFAIYVALIIIRKMLTYSKIIIYTDSMYSINCATKWLDNWNENEWKTSNNKPVKNQDILKPLHSLIKKLGTRLEFVHVHSHTSGSDPMTIGNSIADKLATDGSKN